MLMHALLGSVSLSIHRGWMRLCPNCFPPVRSRHFNIPFLSRGPLEQEAVCRTGPAKRDAGKEVEGDLKKAPQPLRLAMRSFW